MYVQLNAAWIFPVLAILFQILSASGQSTGNIIRNTNTIESRSYVDTNDLFHNLDDIWSSKPTNIPYMKNGAKTTKNSDNILKTVSDVTAKDKGFLEYWTHIQSAIDNMKSTYNGIYGASSHKEFVLFALLDKILSIGNSIKNIKMIKDKFDPKLLDFLTYKWESTKEQILAGSPTLRTLTTAETKPLIYGMVRLLGKKFSNVFQNGSSPLNEEVVIQMMKSSGLKDENILEVLELLDLPAGSLSELSNSLSVEGRSYKLERDGYSTGHSGGHSGGYDHHGGGYGKMTKDPFMLLAALAFATFAAYIIYLLILNMQDMGARGVRSAAGTVINTSLPLSLIGSSQTLVRNVRSTDSSDATMSNSYTNAHAASNFYSYIESFENKFINQPQELLGRLPRLLNGLWSAFDTDRLSRSCARKYFCHHCQKLPNVASKNVQMDSLILASIAEVFGEVGSGKALDIYMEKLKNGEEIDCDYNLEDNAFVDCDNKPLNSVLSDS